jgi:glycosyltransferase involved in cell wall biosynthesis
LVALNDTVASAAKAYVPENATLEISRACFRNKGRFVRQALDLSRDCDTIICGHIRQLPIAWLAKRVNPGIRYYLVAHGIEVWRPFSQTEKTALRGAERVLCVSDFTRQELLKHCPLPEGRAVVLHNALDPVFSIGGGRALADCPPRILVVTRLTQADRYKGVQHMIEAMPAIRRAIPKATLRIIGRGDDRDRLQQLSATLGLADAIDFPGFVPDERLAEEMKSCRLFALPSRKEGFGLVFLEAMAYGRPCLGAAAGGVPEVITPDTGILVNYGDVDGIASAAVDGLRRGWDEQNIMARAREFSFDRFKAKLASQLHS